MLPITPHSIIKLSTTEYTQTVAILKSTTVGSVGSNVDYATGENGVRIISINSSIQLEIPDDGRCLYIVKKTSDNIERLQYLTLKQYTLLTYEGMIAEKLKSDLTTQLDLAKSASKIIKNHNFLVTKQDATSSIFDYYAGFCIAAFSKLRVKATKVTYDAYTFQQTGYILHNTFDESVITDEVIGDFVGDSIVAVGHYAYGQAENGTEMIEINTQGANYISLPFFNSTTYGALELYGYADSEKVWKVIEQINNELALVKQNGSIPNEIRDVPKNITVLNGYKKAKQMLNVEWTPLENNENYKIADRFGSGSYAANVKQKGVPYSAVLETNTYVPQDVSFYTFVSAVNNPYSLLYTENVAGNHSSSAIGKTYHGIVPTNGQRGTYMGSSCSVLVNYCLGIRGVVGASAMYRDEENFVPVYDQSAQGVELMDVLLSSGHGLIVTDVWRTKRGVVTRIKTIEEVGNVVEKTFTAEQFNTYLQSGDGTGYKLTRYKYLYKNIHYTPSPVVAVTDEGEAPVNPVFNSDICVFKGDRCSFAEGDVIRINFFDGTYTAMELYKDDVLIETITTLDTSTHYVDITSLNLTYGKYKARMMKSDSSYSDYTFFEIIDCNVSYDKETYTVSVETHNSVAVQARYVRVTGNIKQTMLLDEITSDSFIFEPTFSIASLTEKVYLIVEFIGEYGGVINQFLDTELYVE
jgi:hypothetical protein